MKSLLRTGWIRAGVPKCDIESLADHSWAVSALTYFFCLEENTLRVKQGIKPLLDTEKAVLYALFHDFNESEYMDIDKSMYNLTESKEISHFLHSLEKGAIKKLSSKLEGDSISTFQKVLRNNNTAESRIGRVADHIDVMQQAVYYGQKNWIAPEQVSSFQNYAIAGLQEYLNEFLFLRPYLEEYGFLESR
jgi:5'-deoxynucleotidase YfbR-like HD superfamily hydrolase